MSSSFPLIPEDKDQRLVITPYGKGIVIRTRKSDGIQQVRLTEWTTSSSTSKQQSGPTLYTSTSFPSIPPSIGNDVLTIYGRGRIVDIIEKKNDDNIVFVVVELSTWRLAGRSKVKCYISSQQDIQVVRSHTLFEMSVLEKIEYAQNEKLKANFLFQKRRYEDALNLYSSAVQAVRLVDHDYMSTNELRADLIVVLITCSNNAGTCCIQLSKWDDAMKYVQHAIVLCDALERRKASGTSKIVQILQKEGIATKLFGEWRIKSFFITAKAQYEKKDYSESISTCRRAIQTRQEYLKKHSRTSSSSDSSSSQLLLKQLQQQEHQLKKLLNQAIIKRKHEREMEKKRAKAMFGNSNSSIESETSKDHNNNKLNNGSNGSKAKNNHISMEENEEGGDNPNKNNMNGTKQQQSRGTVVMPPSPRSCLKKKRSKSRSSTSHDDGSVDSSSSPSCSSKKSVSFADGWKDDGDRRNKIWFEQHYEALVITGIVVVGVCITQLIFSSSRRTKVR